jgi:cytochrome b6-f complex iron-sulfur subunit
MRAMRGDALAEAIERRYPARASRPDRRDSRAPRPSARASFAGGFMRQPGRLGDHASPAGQTPDRRRFLSWLSRAFLGLWGLGAAGVVGAYLKAPERGEGIAERTVRVGMLDELVIGEGRLVRHGVTPFYVIRVDAARVVAMSAVCTHVRCILGFDRERRALVCPCHDGRFDLAGNVLSGPPPRPLASYRVSIRAGEVFVLL